MAETSNVKLGLLSIGGEARIGRLIFKTVSSAAHAETVRIEDELCRQLDLILTNTGSSQGEAVTPLGDERIGGDASLRVKNAVKQLFVYLERIMVLNVSQDLCKRLDGLIKGQFEGVAPNHVERQRFNEVTRNYEARITEVSGRISEYGKRASTCGDRDRMAENNMCVRISDSVSSLLSLTHEVALMLEDLSKKCSELSKENVRLKRK